MHYFENRVVINGKFIKRVCKFVSTVFMITWSVFVYLRYSSSTKGETVHPFFTGRYSLNNESICTGSGTIHVLVVVHTAPDHFARRHNIRTTYGSSVLFKPKTIRVVFLLGRVAMMTVQTQLDDEHALYGDTIQGDFIDAYHNLTIKGVMGLHWVSHYCPDVTYVVKLDDDVAFDMWRFLSVFPSQSPSKTLFCDVSLKGIIRRKGKWQVSDVVYKGYERYPFPHCYGFVVVISGDLIAPLYQSSLHMPFFWIDDVYLFGLLPNAIGKVVFQPAKKELKLPPKLNGLKCLKEKGSKCPVLAVSASEDTYSAIWSLIELRNKKVTLKKV